MAHIVLVFTQEGDTTTGPEWSSNINENQAEGISSYFKQKTPGALQNVSIKFLLWSDQKYDFSCYRNV